MCDYQASAGSRTPGLVLTMDALCRLSYGSDRFRRRERSGPCCRAAPAPTGVAVTRWGGRRPWGPPSPPRAKPFHENPLPEFSNMPGRVGPGASCRLVRFTGAAGSAAAGQEAQNAPPSTWGRRGALASWRQIRVRGSTPATDHLPRVVPNPAHTTRRRRSSAPCRRIDHCPPYRAGHRRPAR